MYGCFVFLFAVMQKETKNYLVNNVFSMASMSVLQFKANVPTSGRDRFAVPRLPDCHIVCVYFYLLA